MILNMTQSITFHHKAQKGTLPGRAFDGLQFPNAAQETRTPAISHPAPVK